MSVTVQQHKNFIGGEWVESEGGTMEVLNPSTGEVIAEVQRSAEADVDRAVEARSPTGSRRRRRTGWSCC
jgi:acyl-CoA reductase-like NAD-dependent aldehyde dehydrogenase